MKIAMLTGGGDVPGLNCVIKAITLAAIENGWHAVGIKQGWQGLVAMDADCIDSQSQWSVTLDANNVRYIDQMGGTILHSSRTHPKNVKRTMLPDRVANDPFSTGDDKDSIDATPKVLDTLKALKLDVLVAIGGDDTLSYAAHLHRQGMPVIGVPKTMDNDVMETDYCIGFATCVSRTVHYLHQLRSCAASHQRFAVVEVMGRNSGASSLVPAYLACADRAIIAEVPVDVGRLAELLQDDRDLNPSRYAMVTVSEGASLLHQSVIQHGEADAFGHRKLGGIGDILGAQLKKRTGVATLQQNLGYLVRSGPPDPLDIMVAFNFSHSVIELIKQRQFGALVRLRRGVYSHAPLDNLTHQARPLDIDSLYDRTQLRPKIKSVLGMPMYLT